jgi:phosphoserine phosphatase
VPIDDPQSASAALAEIAADSAGPEVGAFFDLDGTLVAGFTATAHAGDRIRRRQARIGEVLERRRRLLYNAFAPTTRWR